MLREEQQTVETFTTEFCLALIGRGSRCWCWLATWWCPELGAHEPCGGGGQKPTILPSQPHRWDQDLARPELSQQGAPSGASALLCLVYSWAVINRQEPGGLQASAVAALGLAEAPLPATSVQATSLAALGLRNERICEVQAELYTS